VNPLLNRWQSLKAVRIATYLFPPLGLILLWRSNQIRRRAKVFGTLYIPAYTLIYLCGLLVCLTCFLGIDLVEWRGGYLPRITFSKTVPNYDQLEANRALQSKAAKTNSAPQYLGSYWSGFRGADRKGIYDEQPIRTNWPIKGLPLLWREPLGGGYSSFAVAEGRIYTMEQRRQKESVTAYDCETGRELWSNDWDAKFEEIVGGEGPRATPTYDDGRIYVQGANGELRCVDAATGTLIWRHNIIVENHSEILKYGISASPLIVGEKIITLPGGLLDASVVAYNKYSGAVIWHSLTDKQAYTSPMLVNLAGQTQLLIVSARNVMGVAVEDGHQLWHSPWVVQNENAIAQPVLLSTNRFLISAGYGLGCAAFEVTQSNSIFAARELWRNTFLKNKFTSSVLHNGYIYGLDDDILTCLDAKTGERKWRKGNYGFGQLLLAGDHLVILSAKGELALVATAPSEFKQLSIFQAISGKTWNHPAIANGKIYVRNSVEMACYDLSVPVLP
jgi:outer membrane protein assembly factor BamB